jgi:phosphatidylserine/phosphatidylglycerophosphate/cardiolipin synthase-like enzyme
MSALTKPLFALAITAALTAGSPGLASAAETADPGMTFECGFSPDGTSLETVLSAIEAASGPKDTILVAAYEFTSRPIAQALIAAKGRGVTVGVVADATENAKPYSKVHELVEPGIPVRIDNALSMVHDKFLVIGNSTVETGSFNFSTAVASDRHAENACVFRHAPQMARQFTKEWKSLWAESTPMR